MLFHDDTSIDAAATFKHLPGSDPLVAHIETDKVFGDVNVGVVLMQDAGLSFKLNYEGSFSEHTEAHGGDVKISLDY